MPDTRILRRAEIVSTPMNPTALEQAESYYVIGSINMSAPYLDVPVIVFGEPGHLLSADFATRRARVMLFSKTMPAPRFKPCELHDYHIEDVPLNAVQLISMCISSQREVETLPVKHQLVDKQCAKYPRFEEFVRLASTSHGLQNVDFTQFSSRKYLQLVQMKICNARRN
jgi:hypothetical protein